MSGFDIAFTKFHIPEADESICCSCKVFLTEIKLEHNLCQLNQSVETHSA